MIITDYSDFGMPWLESSRESRQLLMADGRIINYNFSFFPTVIMWNYRQSDNILYGTVPLSFLV